MIKVKGERLKVKGGRLFVFLITASLCLPLYAADNVKDLQNKQKKLQQEIEQTNKLLNQTKKDEKATMNKLQLIGTNIKNQRQLIHTLDNEIFALNAEMKELQGTRDSLQRVLDGYKADYAEMIRQSHFAQVQQSPLLFLMSSDSFQQLARRARYLREFAHFRQEQVRRIENTQAEIDTQNELLKANKHDKLVVLDTRKKEQENLKRDEKKQKTMLNQLKSKEKDLNKQLKAQEKKVAELNKKIDELIRQQAQKASKTTMTKEQQLIAGGFEANKGRLPWPVDKGMISGHYGKQQHPLHEHVIVDNKGIYIQTTAGTKARAVYKGEVTTCCVIAGTYAVIVQHGNYRTVYSNLSSLNVKQGDHVDTKQVLGTIFTDPEQDQKTELYFQIYQDMNMVNPELWIVK
jgi:septal ring factor EnvC (AmiA/AmiB activator)